MNNDLSLLARYAGERDAEAFAELVREYSGMVYATSLRITRNAHDAEDVAQECFMELARQADAVTSSLSGWLHMAAVNRSKNAVRKAASRRTREEQAGNDLNGESEPAWEDIAPYVDEALEALPDDLRLPLILHYLQGKTQTQIAEQLGLSQPTVSRRLETGIEQLRTHLSKGGIVASVVVLSSLLTANASAAAPATLMVALGKMAMAGVGPAGSGAAGAAAASTGVLGTTTAKATAVIVAGAIVAGGIALHRHNRATDTGTLPAPTRTMIAAANKETSPVQTTSNQEQEPVKAVSTPNAPVTVEPVILEDVVRIAERVGKRTAALHHQTRGVILARSICLQADAAQGADYETLMSVSGFGPSFAYHPKQPRFVYFGPFDPKKQDDLIARASGVSWHWTPRGDTVEDTWQKIKALIDAGKPVEGEHLNEVLFVGYQEADDLEQRRIMICGPFEWQTEWWTWQQFSEWWNRFAGHCHLQHADVPVDRDGPRAFAVGVLNNFLTVAENDGRQNADFMGMKQGTYGLAAIEKFAADVADTGKSPDSFDAGWLGCHAVNLQVSGRKSAAVWLARIADEFPAGPAQHIRAAGDAYDAAFAAWQEFSHQLGYAANAPELPELRALWTDATRRQTGAAAIRKALDHERTGIAEIRQALTALEAQGLAANVRREGNRVWIDGVETPAWGNWDENSVMASVVLPALGEDVSYDRLMGLSGAAFRIQVHKDGTCPSSPHANCGFDCTRTVMAALGYPIKLYEVKDGVAAVETARAAIGASIDKGYPVLHQPEECGIIAGYIDNGAKFLCRSYQNNQPDYQVLESIRWGVDVIGRKGQQKDARALAVESLERIVKLANTPEFGTYHSGFAAYDQWITWLRNESADSKRLNLLGNGWIYCSLKKARQSAATYLTEVAGQFDGAPAEHLQAAAAQYRVVNERLGVPHKVAPGPWGIKKEQWTQDMRVAQADVLTDVLRLERAAVAEVEKALAALR